MNATSRFAGLAIGCWVGLSQVQAAERLDWTPFEVAFSTAGEPPWLHYSAEYLDGHGWHRLEVWRDHEQRLRRTTDGMLDVFAQRSEDGDLRYTVRDRKRQIRTTVDRTNLMRVGTFLDWFSQAHGLMLPASGYALERAGHEQVVGRACVLWRLAAVPEKPGVSVCWDQALKLPLVILNAGGDPIWRVTAFDTAEVAEGVFAPEGDGEVTIDMNADLSPDAD